MGKSTRHFLALAWLLTMMVAGLRTFGQTKPGATALPAPSDASLTDTSDAISMIYFQSPARLSTASAAVVFGKDISKMPVVSFPLALAGKLAGLGVTQSSGQPLNEGFALSLRNQAPLILIDGIPRALTEIGVEEIESVTVLKDAVSTAMLGVRGSGGALLVTTKKGYAGKQNINFNIQTGISKPADNLISAPLDAYRYAQLYNEALTNDGLPVPTYGFSNAALEGFRTGADPIKYPNVNWQDQLLKSSTSFARYNVNTRGGNQFVKYFVSVEHVKQNGLLQTSSNNKYNTNSNLAGYFARSNADLKLTENLSAGIYIQGRILNGTNPGNNATDDIFSSILNTPASAYPVYNLNGTYGGSSIFQNNILAQSIGSGYSLSNTRTILSDIYLKGKLDKITQGLWIKARGSFFSNLNEQVIRNKGNAVFEQTGINATGDPVYRQYGTNSTQANSNSISFQNRSDFQELSLGYARDFGNHATDIVVLANRDNLINGSNLPYTIQGLSGHVSYNFKRKYLAEVSFASNGANRYSDDGKFKYGFFPAVGLGWNMKEEQFMKSLAWLNSLKLFGSYGKTGRDNAYYYTYQQVYNAAPAAIFGSSASQATTIGESFLANPNITWEKAKKLNVGIEATLLKNCLSFQVEYYSNKYSDLSIIRGTNSGLLGISYPNENIGRENYHGIETQLTFKQYKKQTGYTISLNAAIQQSELLYAAEGAQKYEWMLRTGQPVGMRFGYVSEGLFQSQQEINGHATIEGYTPQPGDIKYKDLNQDGVINQYDQTAIGKGKPVILLGGTFGVTVQHFDLSILLQGQCNREIYLSGNSYWEFQNSGTGQAYENHLNRWTTATAATASYPRLTTGRGPSNGAINNWVSSSYWLRNGNYLRVRTVELGYNISSIYFKKIGIQGARVYLNAYNPLTISSKTLDGVDPENYTGNYPVQKVFSAGVNIQL